MWHRLSHFHHPFRLMLYLEWILLGITVLGEIRPDKRGDYPPTLALSLGAIAIFGLMGLKLPTGKAIDKVLYTSAEFGLLLLASFVVRRAIFFPLLGIILVIRSCLIFEQLGRALVAALVAVSFSFILFQEEYRPPRPRGFRSIDIDRDTLIFNLKLNTVVTFILVLLFTLLLVNALLNERRSHQKLILANARLREYALQLEDRATLQERNRIAREIHDSLGHSLTAQSIQLENALLFLPPEAEKSAGFLKQAQELGTNALKDVRRSVSTLRDPLRGKSLGGAIAQTAMEWAKTSGIVPEVRMNLPQNPSREVSVALYRIVQESLTNISKHSDASKVKIDLKAGKESIKLKIEDNGRGFDLESNKTGFGLRGMEERAIALGGKYLVVSAIGKGCQIIVSIPCV